MLSPSEVAGSKRRPRDETDERAGEVPLADAAGAPRSVRQAYGAAAAAATAAAAAAGSQPQQQAQGQVRGTKKTKRAAAAAPAEGDDAFLQRIGWRPFDYSAAPPPAPAPTAPPNAHIEALSAGRGERFRPARGARAVVMPRSGNRAFTYTAPTNK